MSDGASSAAPKVAREAVHQWLHDYREDRGVFPLTLRSDPVLRVLERHIATALEAEREACAKQCDAAAAEYRKRAGSSAGDSGAHRYILAAQNFDTAAAFIRDPREQP
jgi:hypothetical protein